ERSQTHFQGMPDRFAPDEIAAAIVEQPLFSDGRFTLKGQPEPDKADRLFFAAAVRPGNPGYRQRDARMRTGQCAGRHFLRGLVRYGTVGVQRRGRNADHLHLGIVGIGDEAAVDHRRRAGNIGQRGDDQAAGATLRRCRQYLVSGAYLQEAVCQFIQFVQFVHAGTSPGNATLGVAIAAMPSLRPMKPSFSLVVALTEMRSGEMPSIAESSAVIAARCGPILGASQISVMSALAMRPPRSRTSFAACSTKMREAEPFHCGSDGGKCVPISPAPQVASNASVSACRPTSASEWPDNFLSCGIVTPQSTT